MERVACRLPEHHCSLLLLTGGYYVRTRQLHWSTHVAAPIHFSNFQSNVLPRLFLLQFAEFSIECSDVIVSVKGHCDADSRDHRRTPRVVRLVVTVYRVTIAAGNSVSTPLD